MKQFIKKYWKTILFFVFTGLFGGFFTGIYVLDSYPLELRNQLLSEMSNMGINEEFVPIFMGIVTGFQTGGYGLILGVIPLYIDALFNILSFKILLIFLYSSIFDFNVFICFNTFDEF